MLIVADANILVRAAGSPFGPAGAILAEIERGTHRLVVSEHILRIVAEKLALPRIRKRLGLSDSRIRSYCTALRTSSLQVVPAQGPPIVPGDPEDDIIVYTAVAGRADVICTWDGHFYQPDVLAFCRRRGIRIRRDIDLLEDLRAV